MKKKKSWRRFLLIMLAVAVAAVIGLLAVIDGVARSAIEYAGSYALGVPTTLDNLDIGLLSGSVRLSGLTVSNPPGFDTPHFFSLDAGHVNVSIRSLSQDKVVVPELILTGVGMNLEQKGEQANYNTILDHLKQFESKEEHPTPAEPLPGPTPEEPTAQGKQFVIEKLAIQDIDVQVSLMSVNGKPKNLPVHIDRIELNDVGADGDQGVKITQITDIVVKAILDAVLQQHDLPGKMAEELQNRLQELQKLDNITAKITDDLQGDLDKAGEKINEKLENVGEKLKKNLNDLFK